MPHSPSPTVSTPTSPPPSGRRSRLRRRSRVLPRNLDHRMRRRRPRRPHRCHHHAPHALRRSRRGPRRTRRPGPRRDLLPGHPWGAWAATTEFKVSYLAPVWEGQLVAGARAASIRRLRRVLRRGLSCPRRARSRAVNLEQYATRNSIAPSPKPCGARVSEQAPSRVPFMPREIG